MFLTRHHLVALPLHINFKQLAGVHHHQMTPPPAIADALLGQYEMGQLLEHSPCLGTH